MRSGGHCHTCMARDGNWGLLRWFYQTGVLKRGRHLMARNTVSRTHGSRSAPLKRLELRMVVLQNCKFFESASRRADMLLRLLCLSERERVGLLGFLSLSFPGHSVTTLCARQRSCRSTLL